MYNSYQHVSKFHPNVFECFSDAADYDYFVRLDDADDMERALDIAERELELYGCPEDAGENFDHYYYSGYVEVVSEALSKAGIEAEYYTKMED